MKRRSNKIMVHHIFHLLNNKYKASFQQGTRQQKLKVKIYFAQ